MREGKGSSEEDVVRSKERISSGCRNEIELVEFRVVLMGLRSFKWYLKIQKEFLT
ncbi:MAG: hypothetical protein RML10_10865 [Geminocystis sp.]|nr:hypothetical protein [Geminocystis sp.]